MEHVQNLSFIVRASTRSFGDDNWRVTEAAYIDAWKSATVLLRERKVIIEGVVYEVTVDWTPLLRRHERHYLAMTYLERGGREDFERRIMKTRFPRRPSKIPVTVRAEAKKITHLQSVVECIIYDVFLIMNIAAPGCCNFYRSDLVGGKSKTEISLSNDLFEICVLPERRKAKKLPAIRFVQLDAVVAWYDTVRSGAAQVPTNATERAIFALLHLAKLGGDAVAVIWLFFAFESLLQTRVGENFNAIVRRVALLLESSASESLVLKKQLRALYDVRSAFVHGGFEAVHPMNEDALDKRAGKAFSNLLSATDSGYAILLAAIQRMAEKGWSELRFDEIVVGVTGVRN